MSGPAGVLLAAGGATRFGANKLLVPTSDGVPMAVCAGRALRATLPRSVAVVSSGDSPLSHLLVEAGLEVSVCMNAARGMGASLACGIAALADAQGWVVALADMPFIRPETFHAVAKALREGAAIAVPRFQGKRGHPVGFSRDFRDALLALDADSGGRDIINTNSSRIVWIEVDDPGSTQDIDTPQDLGAFDR